MIRHTEHLFEGKSKLDMEFDEDGKLLRLTLIIGIESVYPPDSFLYIDPQLALIEALDREAEVESADSEEYERGEREYAYEPDEPAASDPLTPYCITCIRLEHEILEGPHGMRTPLCDTCCSTLVTHVTAYHKHRNHEARSWELDIQHLTPRVQKYLLTQFPRASIKQPE